MGHVTVLRNNNASRPPGGFSYAENLKSWWDGQTDEGGYCMTLELLEKEYAVCRLHEPVLPGGEFVSLTMSAGRYRWSVKLRRRPTSGLWNGAGAGCALRACWTSHWWAYWPR